MKNFFMEIIKTNKYTPNIHQIYTKYTPNIHQIYTKYTPNKEKKL